MATRKTPQTIIESDDDSPSTPRERAESAFIQRVTTHAPPAEIDDYEETAVDRVARLLDGLSNDDKASVKLYRVLPNTAKREWCRDYTPSEFESGGLSMIRSEWGAGQFEIRLYGTHPHTGNFGVIARDSINIAAPMNVQASQPVAQQSELAAVLKTMQEQQAAMLQALTQRPDPMQGMRETLTLMTMMREAMGMGAGSQNNQPQGIGEALKLIRELREVSDEINPAPKTETDSMIGMLGPIVDLVKTHMGANQQAQLQPQPQMQPQPMPQLQHVPNPLPPTPQDQFVAFINSLPPAEADKIMGDLLKALNELMAMASQGKPAIEGGEVIADKIPDEMLEFLERPDCVDMLIAFVPNAASQRQWLIDAVTEANRILDMDDDAPVPDAPVAAG
jgi:hypothetical protein